MRATLTPTPIDPTSTSYVDVLYRAYALRTPVEQQDATGFLAYLESQRFALQLVERAMEAEGIDEDTQQRILRRVLSGGPANEAREDRS